VQPDLDSSLSTDSIGELPQRHAEVKHVSVESMMLVHQDSTGGVQKAQRRHTVNHLIGEILNFILLSASGDPLDES